MTTLALAALLVFGLVVLAWIVAIFVIVRQACGSWREFQRLMRGDW